jgi:uncharacterized protein
MNRLSMVTDLLVDLPRQTLMGVVRAYRLLLKPWLGQACRFEPTCSAYALQALQQQGAARGSALAGWRLLRCHPWCEGGHDPAPAHFRFRRSSPAQGLFTSLTDRPPPAASTIDPDSPVSSRTPS